MTRFADMNIRFSLIIVGLLAGILACDNTIDLIEPHTWDIFPVEEGASRITLRIDSTYNTSGGVEDKYYKRETYSNLEEDLTGRMIRRLLVERSEFDLGQAYQWDQDRVWAVYVPDSTTGDYFIERIEENKRIRILKFPVLTGVKWNGNLLNQDDEGKSFEYVITDTTVTVTAGTFDQCVMVVNKDERSSFIQETYAYEIYAPGVGLIKKFDQTKFYDKPGNAFNEAASYVIQEELIEIP